MVYAFNESSQTPPRAIISTDKGPLFRKKSITITIVRSVSIFEYSVTFTATVIQMHGKSQPHCKEQDTHQGLNFYFSPSGVLFSLNCLYGSWLIYCYFKIYEYCVTSRAQSSQERFIEYKFWSSQDLGTCYHFIIPKRRVVKNINKSAGIVANIKCILIK